MLLHWNVSPEIISIGPITLRWYGLMFLLGFSIGFTLMRKVCEWEGKSLEKLDNLLIAIVLGTTIGARLGHVLFYDPKYYFSNPLEILKIWEGGLASHGGGLGVMIAIWIFVRRNPEFSLMWVFDRIAIFTVMTGGFIRLGNLFNSEILGKPTSGDWGVVFQRVDQFPRHPAQVYESLCYFLVFALTYKVYLKYKSRTPSGLLLGMVFVGIFIARFFIEFVKENQEAFENQMVLNMGQLLSLPFIAVGAYLIVRALRQGPAAVPEPVSSKSKKKKA